MAAAPSLQPPGDLRQRTSLYVGDLDLEVTEMDLKTAFCSVCPFFTLRLCRCAYTGKSLCYGYVNFYSHKQGIIHYRYILVQEEFLGFLGCTCFSVSLSKNF